ncbi:MAG TPA: Crp/Fnr family transcriptional regulator [Clostridiales bacterium]|nr:MAG: transcriptional regulator FixK [Firmicutes bacterium ADurb.Bin262]HOU10881.1 Crp/Fnr family transcriptional regulator [Clostridiales bacterium]HQH63557.1 Crp/Fnr family transcriptional regulator [Clostridiales bacterium]HQK73348.1 Crp/Fnr family transcriptional regulator [Clostridiales bacterium]
MTGILKNTELFAGIEPDDIEGMLGCLNARRKAFGKGEFLLLAGDPVTDVGILLSGEAHIIKENINGEVLMLRRLLPGAMFGESYAGTRCGSSPVSVVAQTGAQAVFLDMGGILGSCRSACPRHSQLIFNMVKIVSAHNIALNNRMFYLAYKTIRERLGAYLLDLAEQNGSRVFRLPMSKTQLARHLCADRSAMMRELSRMKADGLIDYEKDRFRVVSL